MEEVRAAGEEGGGSGEEAHLLGLDLGAGAFARGGEAVLLREDHLEGEGDEVG